MGSVKMTLFIFLTFFSSIGLGQSQYLKITRVTPSGNDVAPGRQIVFTFNRSVVPLGRMERKSSEIPITIKPALKCDWRWIDRKSLACQLGEKEATQYATQYKITVNPGIKDENGQSIKNTKNFSFITERPKLNYVRFRKWLAPGHPQISLTFNQPVSRNSVVKSFQWLHKNTSKRTEVKVERDLYEKRNPQYVWTPGDNKFIDFGPQPSLKPDETPKKYKEDVARKIWLISPTKELQLDSSYLIKVHPGLVSALGNSKGVEKRLVKEFQTFPPFRFLGIGCQNINGDRRKFDGPYSIRDLCDPLSYVYLRFSSPVIKEEAKNGLQFTPDLAGGRTDYDPWQNVYSYSQISYPHNKDSEYTLRLPESLKAWEVYRVTGTVKDEFGRKLDKPINMEFKTNHRRPDMRLIHDVAVVEKGIKNDLPIYLTNIDEVRINYRKVTSKGHKADLKKVTKPPHPQDVAFASPLGLPEMLENKSGVAYGTISTTPTTRYGNRTFFAQITPYQVFVKWGHFNTLVWVTDMKTGRPVSGAKVSLYLDSYVSISSPEKKTDQAKTDSDGLALIKGTKDLDPKLKYAGSRYYNDKKPRFMVRVEKKQELAILPLDHNFGLDSWRTSGVISPDRRTLNGHIHSWGTTAQGIYRAGQKIEYKVYVRNQNNNTFVAPPQGNYHLKIIDPMGKTVHESKKVTLSKFGALHGEWQSTKQAAMGWYKFELRHNEINNPLTPMSVLVTDFTPAPFKVSTELNGDLFGKGDTIKAVSRAQLHSGGPYTDANTRVTATFTEKNFRSRHPVAKTFHFDTHQGSPKRNFFQQTKSISDKGELTSSIPLNDLNILYGQIRIESAVQDDRGKYVASTAHAKYVGVNRFVGLRNTQWVYQSGENSKLEYVVVDPSGRPTRGTSVDIKISRKETKASRVKGAGNAFITKYVESWVNAGQCSGSSRTTASVCRFKPEHPGSYKFQATIKDTTGNTHSTEIWAWVVGKGRVIWGDQDDNSLEIVSESHSYKVGTKARFLIKNPFPGAQALITVERYGILKQWVQKLKGSTPIVEVPIEKDDLPGVFLSVTVVSPRAAESKGFGKLDLGKPTFKIGYVKIPVTDPAKSIQVTTKSDKKVYRPRETVKVNLVAKPNQGKSKEPIEYAVAVLDEAVFDLISSGKANYDPYKGFYTLDGLDVKNFSLLMKLIGRQKFEKKGANQGGGGGGPNLAIRSVFKFLAYWNPNLKANSKGEANFIFQLPDNLTGWRVLAMAVTPTDSMGLGDVNFKVNRPTEIRPIMPNQVTEGDQVKAGFSVMNRTKKDRTLKVTLMATGDAKGSNKDLIKTFDLKVGPFKRESVWLPIQVGQVSQKNEVTRGGIKFQVIAKDNVDKDGIVHHLPVHKRRSLLTAANYGTTEKPQIIESILFPKDIHGDVGGVDVNLTPTVIGNAEGAFKYMRDYPYFCWEQILSKGVMAAHYVGLEKYLSDSLTWNEAKKLATKNLAISGNFQAPNGGMVYYIPQDRYVSPYLSAYTALAFEWLSERGYTIPDTVRDKLHGYLKRLLRRNVMPTFYSQGMSATVRAVALAALAKAGKINPSDIQRYKSHFKNMSLFGKAHYLQASMNFASQIETAKWAATLILGSSVQSGGKFTFNEDLDDSYTRILATPLRANCAILSVFTKYAQSTQGKTLVGDIPFKMVRALTQTRGNRAHFENTQENLFCMNALVEYSRTYEKAKPNMSVKAFLGQELMGQRKLVGFKAPPKIFSKPMKSSYPGQNTTVKIQKEGSGRLYYATYVKYAPKDKFSRRHNAGMDLRKEVSVQVNGKWRLLAKGDKIHRGDVVRTDIFLSFPTARNFVVIDDPVPGGLEPVNRDLKTASVVDSEKGNYKASGGSWYFKFSDWHHYAVSRWSFYHMELKHNAARFYSEYLPPGNYHVSYTAQAIATGQFAMMPVHAEEMYDPDVFGKGLSSTLHVEERK